MRTLPTKRQPADGARYLHYAKRGSHPLVGPFRTSRKPLNVAFVRAQACGPNEGRDPRGQLGLFAALGHEQGDFTFVDAHHGFAQVFGKFGDELRVGVVRDGLHDGGSALCGVAALENA